MSQYVAGISRGRFYASHPSPETLPEISGDNLFLEGFSIGFSNEQNGHYRADF